MPIRIESGLAVRTGVESRRFILSFILKSHSAYHISFLNGANVKIKLMTTRSFCDTGRYYTVVLYRPFSGGAKCPAFAGDLLVLVVFARLRASRLSSYPNPQLSPELPFTHFDLPLLRIYSALPRSSADLARFALAIAADVGRATHFLLQKIKIKHGRALLKQRMLPGVRALNCYLSRENTPFMYSKANSSGRV